MEPATRITINQIVNGESWELIASRNIKVLVAWSHTYNNPQLTTLLMDIQASGLERYPTTSQLSPDLEIVLS